MHIAPVGRRNRSMARRYGRCDWRSTSNRCFRRITLQWMSGPILLAHIHHGERRGHDLRGQVVFPGRSKFAHRPRRARTKQVVAERHNHDQSNDGAFASRVPAQSCLLVDVGMHIDETLLTDVGGIQTFFQISRIRGFQFVLVAMDLEVFEEIPPIPLTPLRTDYTILR